MSTDRPPPHRPPPHRSRPSTSLPADERQFLPLEAELDGSRRPEAHDASPSDPDRYREIFCAGTD